MSLDPIRIRAEKEKKALKCGSNSDQTLVDEGEAHPQ